MSSTNRTAVYGPVRTVVWEGSGRKAAPYPDCKLHGRGARATWMLRFADWDPTSLAEALRRSGFNPSHARPLLRAFYAGAGEIDFSPPTPPMNVFGVCARDAMGLRAVPGGLVRRLASRAPTAGLLLADR